MIKEVSPHAFRPGLANDLLAEGVPFADMMRCCRWASEKVAHMYAARPTLGMLRVSTRVHLLHEVSPGEYIRLGATAHSGVTTTATTV